MIFRHRSETSASSSSCASIRETSSIGLSSSIKFKIDICNRWVDSVGLESISYGTYSLRRTKAIQIYRRTGNIQPLLGHTKLESVVR